MKIGILETGAPPAGLERYGSYGGMVAELLGADFATTAFRVRDGELPDRPEDYAGLVVTGSSAGVYDDLPWIAPLSDFLRQARGRTKMVGICFGHQLMAQAFGGSAGKSDRGWGLGLHEYRIGERAAWMDGDEAATIAAPVTHQDQVNAPPPGARVLAGSEFTPYGVLAYDERSISFQCHPEFAPDYAKALLRHKHAGRLPADELERIAATLDRPDDRARIGAWIGRFLRS